MAASGGGGARWSVDIGEFPVSVIPTPLRDFLKEELEPLSLRAAKGFLDRFEVSSLKKDKRFVAALRRFVRRAQKLVPPSSGTRHKMKSVAQSETNLELKLINALRSTRLKFEQNAPAVPGLRTRPDIVFRNKKVAVYVDGCFWHACPHHGTRPRSNSEFWDEKLRRNADRDQENTRALQERGWTVIRFWGHQGAVEMVETLKRTLKAG